MRTLGAASPAAWDFSGIEVFWERFTPLSPWGKDEKERRRVLADRASIEALYDATDAALALLARRGDDSSTIDRITYHLKRLPRLSLAEPEKGAAYELTELFQVKKFIANYRAVAALVGEEAASFFGLHFGSERLAAALDLGGSDAETFYVADAYDERLRTLRKRIREADAAIADARAAAAAAALERHGVDFGGREFVVVSHTAARGMLEDRTSFSIEAYDDSSYIVRIQPGDRELAVAAEREGLMEAERAVEESVLAALSRLVIEALPSLREYVEAVAAFDLARARAELAMRFRLVRPLLSKAEETEGGGRAGLRLADGRYLPCAWECERLGLRYTPIDLSLDERAAVIFGSNMGGKTVALKSLLFMQILAQAGFFVPAGTFATSAYPLVHYVGELGGQFRIEGLSGFGFEIRSFVEAWEGSRGGAFVVFDEFARTTSSREAEAILSAVLEALAARPGVRCLFSTHFRGVARMPGVRYLRVRGLDRASAREAICEDRAEDASSAEPLNERIRRINGMMEYGLVDDATVDGAGSDAVAIASLLGLDRGIVERAEEFYAGGRGCGPG
jgi:DNA mismatch repair ATPase MutS